MSNLMRKFRTETTLRKEAEDQNRKIQQEKLALESYLQNLPSLDEFQQIQTDLELKSITNQKFNDQLQDVRHELNAKSIELSNSQRDALKLQIEVQYILIRHMYLPRPYLSILVPSKWL